MATIRERGPYQWQAQILRKGHPPQYKTFNNKADAEKWARQIEAEMDRGVFVSRKEAENMSLSEILDRYEREVLPQKKGISQVRSQIRFLKSRFGNLSLSALTPSVISKFRDSRSKEVGPQMVRHDLSLLSRVFNVVVKEWDIHLPFGNPVRQVRMPPMPHHRDRRLLPGELDLLLSASESPTLSHIVQFALETGMRRSELSGMAWDRVDLKKRTVLLPDTKNGEKRIVPLSTEAVRILSALPRRLDGNVWGMASDSITQAFIRALGRARAAYEKDCEEKGEKPDPAFLVDLTFHDLRHEATSRFFEKGLNPMQVAAITGHKTLQMLKRYTHLKAEDLAKLLK